jgi:hypothetical protein
MALHAGANVRVFIEQLFNMPSFAEAYRLAALDLLGVRS